MTRRFRLGTAAARRGEEEPTGHQQGRHGDTAAGDPRPAPGQVGRIHERLADQRQDQEHPRVGVAGTGELLLERGQREPTADDPEQVQTAGLDGHQREEEDPGELA